MQINPNQACARLALLVIATFVALMPAATAQTSDTAKQLNLNGIKLQASGKLAEAAEQYRKAIQLNPNGAAYHNNLALVLKDLEQLENAEQEARLALKLRPKSPDYHYNLGIILQRLNRWEQAETEFRDACNMNAMDTEFHFRLGQTLKQLNKLEEAEKEVKLAILLKPDAADYHRLLGDILMQEGKHEEEALYEYRRVVDASNGQITGDLQSKIDYLRQMLKTR